MFGTYKYKRINLRSDQEVNQSQEPNESQPDNNSITDVRQLACGDQPLLRKAKPENPFNKDWLIISVIPVDGINEERGHQVVLEFRVLHVFLRLREKLLIARCGGQPVYKKKLEVELFKNHKVMEHLDLFKIHINQAGDTDIPREENVTYLAKIQNEIIDELLGYFRPKLFFKTDYDLSEHSKQCRKCQERDKRDENYFDTLDSQTFKNETVEGFEQIHTRIVKWIQGKYNK